MRERSRRVATAFTAVILLSAGAARGDPPAGYYDPVDPLTQASLRATLHEVIDDHVSFPYTSANTDTWDIRELADEDPVDPAKILDLYKNAIYPKGSGRDVLYEREHSWPS